MERLLNCEEMRRVIEGRGAAYRIPMVYHPWIYPNAFGKREQEIAAILEKYPCDAEVISLRLPDVFYAPEDEPSYRWMNIDDPFPADTPYDRVTAIEDWGQLDAILADFPDPYYFGLIPADVPPKGERYRIGHWWFWLFERFWSLRGMENALCDLYEHPAEVHRLFRALTDFYKVVVRRAHEALGLDAIWTSDDIGTQTGPFFSLELFRIFFKPYYKELVAYVHSLGMHFWMHCCGNIQPFLPDLIEIGIDVLHPIQKYTMDEVEIAHRFGEDICIWAGFDVQQIIPYGTEEQVREEVRHLIDIYARPEGRFILGAGNGITEDTRPECLEALLEESMRYGRRTHGTILQ